MDQEWCMLIRKCKFFIATRLSWASPCQSVWREQAMWKIITSRLPQWKLPSIILGEKVWWPHSRSGYSEEQKIRIALDQDLNLFVQFTVSESITDCWCGCEVLICKIYLVFCNHRQNVAEKLNFSMCAWKRSIT